MSGQKLKGRPKSKAHRAAISAAHRKNHPPFWSAYSILVRNAGPRGILVGLTFEEYLTFVGSGCHYYCGAGLPWSAYSSGSHNLDRKDNTRGYSRENCVPCCGRCNHGKSHLFSYEEWVIMARALHEHRENPNLLAFRAF